MFYIAYLYVVLSANVKSMGRKKEMDLCKYIDTNRMLISVRVCVYV